MKTKHPEVYTLINSQGNFCQAVHWVPATYTPPACNLIIMKDRRGYMQGIRKDLAAAAAAAAMSFTLGGFEKMWMMFTLILYTV